MVLHIRFTRLVLAAFLFVCTGASAQPVPRSVAVLSLIGDSLSIHSVRQDVGLRVSGENRIVVDYPSSALDQAAMFAAERAMRFAAPGTTVKLMMSQDLALYAAQNAMFDAAATNKDNRDYLISLLREQQASHLILITKVRANSTLKLKNGSTGPGTLEGLGFYVDDTMEVRSVDTRELRNGIVAPFAYIQVRLLDAATLEVLRSFRATESLIEAKPSASDDAIGTWASISDKEKLDMLQYLINKGIAAGMPALIAK